MGAWNAGAVGRNRDSEPISSSIACCDAWSGKCIHSAAMDRGDLITLLFIVAGKRRPLVDGGRRRRNVYDKKPQRYAKDNKTEQRLNCTQW